MINYWKPFEIDEENKRIVLGNMSLPVVFNEGLIDNTWDEGWLPAKHILIPPSADLFAPADSFSLVYSLSQAKKREYDVFQHLKRNIFQTIDATPATTFCVVTRWPERAHDVMAVWTSYKNRRYKTNPIARKNVVFTLQIDRQADLSKVPDLLKLKDLCGGLALRVEPEEAIDLTDCLLMAWAGRRARGRIDQLFVAGGKEVLGYGRWMVNAKKIANQAREVSTHVYVESDDVSEDLKIRELAPCGVAR